MRLSARLACRAFALAALVGCQRTDPYVRDGLWRPTNANDANLRAMIADPRDLQEGHGATSSSGDIAAAAVARLRQDATKPLADSSISSVHVSGAGAAPAASAGSASAADPVAAGGGQ